jgi:hypothetical protein
VTRFLTATIFSRPINIFWICSTMGARLAPSGQALSVADRTGYDAAPRGMGLDRGLQGARVRKATPDGVLKKLLDEQAAPKPAGAVR